MRDGPVPERNCDDIGKGDEPEPRGGDSQKTQSLLVGAKTPIGADANFVSFASLLVGRDLVSFDEQTKGGRNIARLNSESAARARST